MPLHVSRPIYDNGLLQSNLDRKIPEAMKPRKIEIGSGNPSSKPMKSLNAAWEKADMGGDSWFHTFAIELSDFRSGPRPYF
jgi:hypothetical protein